MQSFEIISKKPVRRRRRPPRHLPPYSLYSRFKWFYEFAVLCAAAGVALSTVDYEQRYSPSRTHSNLAELPATDTLRLLACGFTIAAGAFTLMKECALAEWRAILGRPRQGLWKAAVEISLLALFPYPGVEASVSMQQRLISDSGWTYTECKYTVAEMLLAACYLRIYFLYDYFLSTSPYNDSLSMSLRPRHYFSSDSLFALKCYFYTRPVLTVICLMVPITAACAMTIAVFERPLTDISVWDFYPISNAFWLVSESVLSLNFGELVPISHIGRVASIAAGLTGVVLISIIVNLTDRLLRLSSRQLAALRTIHTQRKARTAILTGFLYYKLKKNNKNEENSRNRVYGQLQGSLNAFKLMRLRTYQELSDESNQYALECKIIDTLQTHVDALLRRASK